MVLQIIIIIIIIIIIFFFFLNKDQQRLSGGIWSQTSQTAARCLAPVGLPVSLGVLYALPTNTHTMAADKPD